MNMLIKAPPPGSITGSVYADVTRRCLSLIPISGDIVELERELAGALSQCSA